MPRQRYKAKPTYLALTERLTADGRVFEDILDLILANEGVTKERRGMRGCADANSEPQCETSPATRSLHFL